MILCQCLLPEGDRRIEFALPKFLISLLYRLICIYGSWDLGKGLGNWLGERLGARAGSWLENFIPMDGSVPEQN
jgi:hypothetical protein